MDERLGLEKLVEEQLSDSRQGLNKQFTLADLLRQSVYSRLVKHARYYFAGRGTSAPAPVWPDAVTDLGSADAERVAHRLRLENLGPSEEDRSGA